MPDILTAGRTLQRVGVEHLLFRMSKEVIQNYLINARTAFDLRIETGTENTILSYK